MKIFIGIVGFAFGIFLLFNSTICFHRFNHGYRLLEPHEWLISSIITFVVGIILIIWTILLLKRKKII